MEKINIKQKLFIIVFILGAMINLFVDNDLYTLFIVFASIVISVFYKLTYRVFLLLSAILIVFATISFYLGYDRGIESFGNFVYLFLLTSAIFGLVFGDR